MFILSHIFFKVAFPFKLNYFDSNKRMYDIARLMSQCDRIDIVIGAMINLWCMSDVVGQSPE